MNSSIHTNSYFITLIIIFFLFASHRILKRRKDLRVIISSATLDAQKVKDFFSTCCSSSSSSCIMSIEGRTYPVERLYLSKPAPDYLAASADAVMEVHTKEGPGDILVFLPGQEEIDTVLALLSERRRCGVPAAGGGRRPLELLPLPLYSGLPYEEQMRAFEPAPRGTRKVILATNIAETSVTINGVVYVIDAGFVKVHLPITIN